MLKKGFYSEKLVYGKMSCLRKNVFIPVLWIRIGLNVIRIRIREFKPMRIQADPDPGQAFKTKKSLHEK